jgi:hypothetical protein
MYVYIFVGTIAFKSKESVDGRIGGNNMDSSISSLIKLHNKRGLELIYSLHIEANCVTEKYYCTSNEK